MIIFSRRINWVVSQIEHTRKDTTRVISSVNLDNEVYLEIEEQGILLSPSDAIALAEAILRAAKGQGVPCGPHTPGTSDDVPI